MKKIICVIITVVLLSIMIIGCSSQKVKANDSMFIYVSNEKDFYVVYEKDTKVMYMISNGMYNCGTITLLVDQQGNPMIYGRDYKK